MSGRRRTINRKEQRAPYEEEEEKKKKKDEDLADEEEEEDEDEEDESDSEADADDDAEDDEDEDDQDEDEDEDQDEDDEDEEEDEDSPRRRSPKKGKAAKDGSAKPSRSSKKSVRQKAVWVIYDNSTKPVETFPFNQKQAAEKFLAEKSQDKKGLYLQMVKVPIDEK